MGFSKVIKRGVKYLISVINTPYYIYLYIKIYLLNGTNNGFVVISPSLTLSGAPLLSKAIYEELRRRKGHTAILMSVHGGEYSFKSDWESFNLKGCKIYFFKKLIFKLLVKKGYSKFICNSVVSSELSLVIKECGGIVVSLIHEMASVIKSFELESSIPCIDSNSKTIVFSSTATHNDFLLFLLGEKCKNYVYLKQGIYNSGIIDNYSSKGLVRSSARSLMNICDDKKVVLGIGNDLERKGFSYFLKLSKLSPNTLFIWVSDNKDVDSFISENLIRIPMVNLDKTYEIFFLADVFFLSSIEDPFPSVILEAMLAGLPVISIENSGGADEIVNHSNGFKVSRTRIEDACIYLEQLDSNTLQEYEKHNHHYINENYCFKNYVDSIVQLF